MYQEMATADDQFLTYFMPPAHQEQAACPDWRLAYLPAIQTPSGYDNDAQRAAPYEQQRYAGVAWPNSQHATGAAGQLRNPSVPDPSGYDQLAGPAVDPTCPNAKHAKPPYSYAALICMAISGAADKRATMREILSYIELNFAYYRSHKKWHGTIRHDLTVNDCFVKLPARPRQKGCLWTIDPHYQDMFDNGSLRRRRYRFKEGSAKWLKARKACKKDVALPSGSRRPPTLGVQAASEPLAVATCEPAPSFDAAGCQWNHAQPAATFQTTFGQVGFPSSAECGQRTEISMPDPGNPTAVRPSVSPFSMSSGYNSGTESSLDFSQHYAACLN